LFTVIYQHKFNYTAAVQGSCPVLQLSLRRQDNPEIGIDTEAYLDSGAEASLFNGGLLAALEMELLNGSPKPYSTTFGDSVTAYLHKVQLTLPAVGEFDLEIGFSNGEIRGNLLGRDFFNLVQVGFRERQMEYFLTSTP
jgi:hypothetical protein